MRWYIQENKKRIATECFEGHKDDIEMSGEQVSGVIAYGVNDGILEIERLLIYPMFRTHPDVTQSSYKVKFNEGLIDLGEESFERVELDGVLTLYTSSRGMKIIHRLFPSTELPVFYESIEILNEGSSDLVFDIPKIKRIKTSLCCRGYVYTDIISDKDVLSVKVGEKNTVTFGFYTRFANEEILTENDPLAKRRKRVDELMEVADLTTGNDIVDTMFAFAKLRAGESIFKTSSGRVHSPGGTNYYAAIWCNDQSEYSTPWFAFTGDEKLNEAAENAQKWLEPYMNDEYLPIPSSIISEATDFWNGAGDRGDASMYLYGNSRYFLTTGKIPSDSQQKMLDWCAEYIVRKFTPEGVIFSDTDELENRISSGINLNTSSLTYGGLGLYCDLLKKIGRSEDAKRYECIKIKLKKSIDEYFGADLKGYKTYAYHKGCTDIRAWNCLPVYMGITERAEDTLRSIDERLWKKGSLASTEGEEIMWDRSALYYIASLFRSGNVEKGFEKLKEFSAGRLLGDRVPYAVEAYPEYNMRHLSGESALFCRVITDGLLNVIQSDKGCKINARLPKELEEVILHNIFLDGKYQSFRITKEGIIKE